MIAKWFDPYPSAHRGQTNAFWTGACVSVCDIVTFKFRWRTKPYDTKREKQLSLLWSAFHDLVLAHLMQNQIRVLPLCPIPSHGWRIDGHKLGIVSHALRQTHKLIYNTDKQKLLWIKREVLAYTSNLLHLRCSLNYRKKKVRIGLKKWCSERWTPSPPNALGNRPLRAAYSGRCRCDAAPAWQRSPICPSNRCFWSKRALQKTKQWGKRPETRSNLRRLRPLRLSKSENPKIATASPSPLHP